MKREGLGLCEKLRVQPDFLSTITNNISKNYDLERYAHLREYVTEDEYSSIMKKRFENKQEEIKREEKEAEREEKEIERKKKEREEKFIAKFGPDKSKWSNYINELFYHTSENP